MKVLVTGATGFVGSHTAKALKEAGHELRVLVRSASKAKSVFEALGVTIDDIIVGDITDAAAVTRAVAGCDAVVHSAAMVSTAENFAEIVYKTNVGGTKLLIDSSLAAGIKKIIYVSSVSALFTPGDNVMTETSAVSMATSPYGRSKVDCENYVRQLQAQGAPIIITYPAGVVGSHDPGLSEPHSGIKIFVSQFAFTSSSGMQFVNVSDVAKAHVAILERVNTPERFMLGGQYYSWGDLLRMTENVTGRKLFSIHIPGSVLRIFGRCADVVIKITGKDFPFTSEGMTYATQWVYADSSKIENELGIIFTEHEKTLAEAIHWLYSSGQLSAKKAGKLAY
jgi:nucleoside-diphosphate-sugar epimerase